MLLMTLANYLQRQVACCHLVDVVHVGGTAIGVHARVLALVV
jgi:hypothetical protein